MMKLLQLPSRTFVRAVLLHVLLALIFSGDYLTAQVLDSKGKEFWVAFMANLGSSPGDPPCDLRFYLSAEKPATVTITHTATGQSRVITMATANVSREVNINGLFGDYTELDDVFGFAEISRRSYHITSTEEITLYGINILFKSADAFLGLPVDVLTGRYIVLAYPNGWDNNTGSYDTPSQFCVIGTEDNTQVRITSPAGTRVNSHAPAVPFTVTLNRGQVFFGQAALNGPQDVSGTEILADKPVAVFGGHKRTSIPTRVGNYRDHLVEQLPPLDAWGRNALVTPHFEVTPGAADTAVVRILAAFLGTEVTITDRTGSQKLTLGPGISIELPLIDPMSVIANQPIMVAQYEHSVGTQGNLGDPFMMLVPPSEQFDTAYAFQSVLHSEFANAHYINVVIPSGGQNSMLLDNRPLNGNFRPIPGSRYLYAQVRVGGGSHYIRADSAFGLYVYGYGEATSYGYPGGMLFRTLVIDFQPPEISWDDTCGTVRGVTYDDKITDSGLDSVYTTGETKNVNVTIDKFEPGEDSVSYTAQLLDPYEDGAIGIKAIDRGGRIRTQTNLIPGFTVRVAGTQVAPAVLDTFMATNSQFFCRQVTIRNYGQFEQEIAGAVLAESFPGATITTGFPMKIPPGGAGNIEICFDNMQDTVFSVTLDIRGLCVDRRVAIIPIDSRIDTTAPSVALEGRPCADEFIVNYYERGRASGIVSVEVDTLVNCTAEMMTDTTKLPVEVLQLRLRRDNPRQDIIYAIKLRDAAGNTVIDRDTIGGFTVAVLANRSYTDTLGMRFERDWYGDSVMMNNDRCDSVLLTNYGSQAMSINRVLMRGNIRYSVPPAQFPITIPAGEMRWVTVCIEGVETGMILDTMVIFDECDHIEELKVVTPILSANGEGLDNCNNAIGITTYAPTKRNFLTTPLPNPAHTTVTVDVALSQSSRVNLEIFDASGNPALPVLRGIDLPAGINRVAFDVSKLDNGAYFCRMQTATGQVFVEKLVVTR